MRDLRREESGVSAVVGAVLLVALFSTAATIYTVTTLPQWKADREHNHQVQVQQELAGLLSDLEAVAARRDTNPVSAAVPLQVPKVPLLQSSPARGSIGVDGDFTADLTFAATPRLFASDGVAVAAPTRALGTPPCAGNCVDAVHALVVGVSTTVNGAQTASITLTITDAAASTLTATIAHLGTGTNCPSGELRLTVGGVAQPLLCAGNSVGAPDPYRVDLMDEARFTAALGRLERPLQVAFTTGGPGSTAGSGYAMVFEDADGQLQALGTGVATADPVQDVDGVRVAYHPRYQAYPSQDLVLEGGALLVDGGSPQQAMSVEPSFSMAIDEATGTGTLTWTLVELQGSSSVGGSDSASVSLAYQASQDVILTTPATCDPCLSVLLGTPTAAGWAGHLDLAALTAGAQGSATVSSTDATATLELASGAGLPVTAGWVLRLRIIQAEVTVT